MGLGRPEGCGGVAFGLACVPFITDGTRTHFTELLDESSSAVAKLAVHTKPIRRVVATGHHAVAEVHLAPETTNVKCMTDKELAAASPEEVAAMVEVNLEPPLAGLRFFWLP